MPWPDPQDYREALQNPIQNFGDPELQDGLPELDRFGMPRPRSGNFASVYRIQSKSRVWAVRCFLRESGDKQQRYEEIGKYLASAKSPYTVGFEYLSKGIRVKGQWYPILKMEWVQGELLHSHLANHVADVDRLRVLSDRWLTLIASLRAANIAHGDLQHGNIVVAGDDFKLIDYDGMFVPGLAGRDSHELGDRNYQHPHRNEHLFNSSLDTFSAWIIYLSMFCLTVRPELWARTQAGDGRLLFQAQDYVDPFSSHTLAMLKSDPDARLQAVAGFLTTLACSPPGNLPQLDNSTSALGVDTPPLPTIAASSTGRPAWISDYTRPPGKKTAPAPAQIAPSAAWIFDYLQPIVRPEVADFRALVVRDRRIVWSGIGCAAATSSAISFVVATPLAIAGSIVGLLLFVGLVAVGLLPRYLSSAPARTAKTFRRDEGRHQQSLQRLERGLGSIMRANAVAESDADRARAALRETRRGIEGQKTDSVNRANWEAQAQIKQISDQRAALFSEEAGAIKSALRRVQDSALHASMAGKSIIPGDVPGIGSKTIVILNAFGYRSAFDINQRVHHVPGIGQTKTQLLLQWRSNCESYFRSRLPDRLPASDESAIRAKYQHERQVLGASEATIRKELLRTVTDLQRNADYDLQQIDVSISAAEQKLNEERTLRWDATLSAQQAVAAERWRHAQIAQAAAPFVSITLRRYLLDIFLPFRHVISRSASMIQRCLSVIFLGQGGRALLSRRARLIAGISSVFAALLCLTIFVVTPWFAHPSGGLAPTAVASAVTPIPSIRSSTADTPSPLLATEPPPAPTAKPTRPAPIPYAPMEGSWIATAPRLGIRFFAVPMWEQRIDLSTATVFRLSSPTSAAAFQNISIVRANICCSNSSEAWQVEVDAYAKVSAFINVVITSGPRPQQAAGYDGYIGQFHYNAPDDHNRYDVTFWVGDVDGDRVLLIFTCEPSVDSTQDLAVRQVLGTIDFNAR